MFDKKSNIEYIENMETNYRSKPLPVAMNMDFYRERNKMICADRVQGMRALNIAYKYDLTPARIYKIIQEKEKWLKI